MAEGEDRERYVTIGGVDHSFRLRRSRKAKHLLLHVDVLGAIEVVVPRGVSLRDAEAFVGEQREWLAKQLAAKAQLRGQVARRELVTGTRLPLLGEERRLEVVVEAQRKRLFYTDGPDYVRVFVADRAAVRTVVERWYRREARDYFTVVVRRLAVQVGRRVGKLVISNAGTQWGSCNARTGRISLHWRLLLADRGVADYVAAHEVAHLVEPNHSKRFWALVGRLQPDYEESKRWLKKHGHMLVL